MVTSPALRALMTPGWVRDPLWTRAQRVPSLDLRFAANRSLRDHVSGAELITFTRASSATVIGPTGLIETVANDVPRFQHDPLTGQCLGLLVEEQRANLLVRSEAMATSPWFAGPNTTVSDNTGEVLDPAGGSTATKVVVSGVGGAFGQSATLTAAIYTGSIWLRCSTGTVSASLIVYLANSPFTNIGTTSVTITTSWQRFTVVTSTATAAAYNLQLNAIAVGTVYAWGAQLEAGAFPTSYIKTEGTSATRSADIATITGTAFSRWYRQDEGTVFADANSPTAGTHFTSDDGTNNNRVVLYYNLSTDPRLFVASAGATSCNIAAGTIASDSRALIVGAYKLNDFAASVNGLAPVLDTLGNAPSGVDRARIGRSSADGGYLNGCLRRIVFWPTRLSNATLQALTR